MGWKRIILIIIAVPLVFLITFMVISQFVPAKPPSDFLFTHNIVDLNQVQTITQFRGCNGHRTMSQYSNEPTSSMTNFVMSNIKSDDEGFKIYAPFDGYVTHVLSPDGINLISKSSKFPWWPFNQWRLFVAFAKTLPKFEGTAPMKAGELIGYSISPVDPSGQKASRFRVFDFRLGVIALPPQIKDGNGEPWKKMDSIFNYMTPQVFDEYKKAIPGIESTEDFIIPVFWREKHLCKYKDNGPYFDSSNVDNYINEKYRGIIYLGIENTPDNIRRLKSN